MKKWIIITTTILILIISLLAYLIFFTKTQKTQNFLQTQKIQSLETKNIKEENIELPLEKFPSNLEKISKNYDIEKEEKIKILRYGKLVLNEQTKEEIDLKKEYVEISKKELPIYINTKIIDTYFLTSYNSFKNKTEETLTKELLTSLSPKLSFNNLPIYIQNISKYTQIQLNLSKENNYVELIKAVNSLNKEEKELLISLSKDKEGIDKINKTSLLLGYDQILTETQEQQPFNIPLNDVQYQSSIYEDILKNVEIYCHSTYSNLENYLNIINLTLNTSDTLVDRDNLNQIKTTLVKIKECDDKEYLSGLLNALPVVKSNKKYTYTQLDSIKKGKEILLVASPVFLDLKENTTILKNNFDEQYPVKPSKQALNSIRIPVLMYHHIDDVPKGASPSVVSMYITPKVFEQQMAYLLAYNYKTLSTEEFSQILQTGKNPPEKSVLITFDDGTRGQYTNAFPILKKYNLKATFFIVSQRSAIFPKELKEMANAGMSIESHSATHQNLKKLTTQEEINYQIGSSKIQIQNITEKNVNAIAFPGCEWDKRTLNAMSASGYKLGFSCGKNIDHYYSDRFVISRKHISNEMVSFKKILSGKF